MNDPFPRMPLPRELTYEFLGTFARCEYALKTSGYANVRGNAVEANWDAFSDDINDRFQRVETPAFREAVNYLLAHPPRKQFIDGHRMVWQDSPPDANRSRAWQTLLMVRRVRNNLFHGAKVWSPQYGDRQRDVRLVEAALLVLQECSRLDPRFFEAYEIGVF